MSIGSKPPTIYTLRRSACHTLGYMKIWLICMLLLTPGITFAQFKCTMPGGAVVFSRLSPCPADAVKAESLERVPDSVKPQFKGEYRAPAPLVGAPSAPVEQKTPTERDIVNEAYAICVLLKLVGASTCEVEVNVFSPSFIDATIPGSVENARAVCLEVTKKTREKGSPFIGRGWQLKLFSPLGSGTRPMAQCTL